MPEETLYELRKDICMPGSYMRAGIQKTRKEWKILFPHIINFDWEREWFLLLGVPNKQSVDQIQEIVDEVFDKEGLKSISYKEAAAKAIRLALTRLKT